MPEQQEQFVEVDGAQLWTSRQGEGYPLMLSSGGPGCCDYLAPVAGLMDDLTEVFRWEQRGCGRSEAVEPYDLTRCLADLEGLRKAFGLERWIIGGHSWGANLALIYALEYPTHTAAVIHLSGTSFDEDWKAAYHEGLATRGERQPDYAYPPNMEVNRQVNASKKPYHRDPELPARLRALEIPVLVVHGDRDIRPTDMAERLAAQLPQVRLEIIPEAEHVLWPTHTPELRRILRDFLQELKAEGRL
jgi:proline iminopeptidase